MDINLLYKEYSNTLFHVCNKYLNDYEMAKDAVHDVFIKAYQRSDQFKGQSKEISWLYRIAINHCIDIIRVSKRRKEIIDQHKNEMWESIRENDDPELDSKKMVNKVLAESNESLREVATLYYFENLNHSEIAELVGVTRVAITKRLVKFREKAYKTLESESFLLEDI